MLELIQNRSRWIAVLLGGLVVITVAGCGGTTTTQEEPEAANEPMFPELTGYEPMVIPADNPMTPEKVALGKQLYYDQRLSGDGQHSCYGCHLKEDGLTDGRPVAIGAFDKTLTRSSPTLWNVGYQQALYWDGRSPSLEAQVKGAWGGGNMGATGNDGAPSMEDIVANVNNIPGYSEQFQTVFGGPATVDNVAMAVAAFMRTIVSNDSAWVRFQSGDQTALSEAARRGYTVFSERAKCTNCHDGLLMTDLQYHNVGIGMDAADPDTGRERVTGDEADTGAFKTPTLLDISKSAPYFHDGSVATLEEAVDLMLAGGIPNAHLDETNLADTMNADLTDEERTDLLTFLRELDVNYDIEGPALP